MAGKMTGAEILLHRLHNQRILTGRVGKPADVVRWLGAVQAQDYPGSLWAVGLRAGGATAAEVEKAVRDREIVRTWPMRGTLHFVPAADARWMLALLTRRPVARAAALHRRLEIDRATVSRAARAVGKALQGGKLLARGVLYRLLESSGIPVEGQRGLHILWLLAQQGLICFGPRQGKQHTFALLEEWLPAVPVVPREVALATLAERYFSSHGPATLRDFAWWTGLAVSDAREGLEKVKPRLAGDTSNGSGIWMKSSPPTGRDAGAFFLLPTFDEYMVGYTDREAALEAARSRRIAVTAAQALSSVMLRDGLVVGTWRRTLQKDAVTVTPAFFIEPGRKDRAAFDDAANAYGRFLGIPATIGKDEERTLLHPHGRSSRRHGGLA